MKSDKINRWLSLGANFGVIAGIIFLGIEIQQNNQLLRNEARYNMMLNVNDGTSNRAADADLMAIRVKAINGEDLSQIESLRLEEDVRSTLVNWVWEFEQYELGFIDQLPIEGWRRYIERYPYVARIYLDGETDTDSSKFDDFMKEHILSR